MTKLSQFLIGALSALSALALPHDAAAQTKPDTAKVDKTFFTRRDAMLTGAAIVGTVGIAQFDERIQRWVRSPRVQGDSLRREHFDVVTKFNETPLTILAVLTYGIGRLTKSETAADVGAHWSQAIILNNVVSELVRGPVGRVRPRVSPDNAFKFEFGGGFTKFEDRSFPSLHASSAFATAAALVGEVHERRPDLTIVAAPVLYGLAMIPGVTRLYLDQHWASDVAAGMFVGTLLGAKVVRYAHSHRRTRIDRWLLGTTIVPTGSGGVAVGASFTP
jgi:membrane-associated phospholipid phosphatase